ncbi:MAG: hypothetical protein WBV82_05880 [Myxococcaceae bacterium]
MTAAEAEDVEVYIGEFPAGISMDEGRIEVAEDSEFQVAARVHTNMNDSGLALMGVWGYAYDEDEAWRKPYCYAQIPLNWITLTTWSWYTPFYWPCRVYESNSVADINRRKQRIIQTLKKATKAAGGEILVVTGLGRITTINASTGQQVGTMDMTGAEGYALRRRKQTDALSAPVDVAADTP